MSASVLFEGYGNKGGGEGAQKKKISIFQIFRG